MSKLLIVAGTKGGIGKTLISTFFADIAGDYGLHPVLFDCDDENQSLSNVYKNVPGIEVSSVTPDSIQDMDYPLDAVINRIEQLESSSSQDANERLYILDMKAGTSVSTLEWLEAFPFAHLSEVGVEIFLVGCLTAEVDSSLTWGRWLLKYREAALAGELRFIIVKNKIAGENFDFYNDKMKQVQEEYLSSTIVIDFPEISSRHLRRIRENGASYGQVAKSLVQIKSFGFMDMHRIRLMYAKIKDEFDGFFRNAASGKVVENGGKQSD